ncbi:MAG: alpha/beta hydrolase [Ruminococcaceae bacterium]|nr:alpha/beta hydrolase [Oscillospiraceae bacterium]
MDITLHAVDVGAGKPLVLLHGNGESSEYFTHQLAVFPASRRVIAVDTRGHGKSPRGTAPFTLAQFAEDLRELLDQKGIEKADLLGFSDGGNIAMLFALKYPERVDRLILNGANLYPRGVKLAVQLPVVLGYGIVSLIAKFDKKAVAKKEILGLMVREPHIDPKSLAALPHQTLVIVGDRDMIRHRHSKLIADSIPNAKFVILPGSHFIAAEESAEFNRAVEAFLAE